MTRASAAHNPGVSLFPFLAVLICTMGVMMLLLVIINRPGAAAIDDSEPPPGAVFEEGGKGSATTIASGKGGAASAAANELQSAREMLNWRLSQLEISREKTIGDLRDERMRLTTVEDGMRKLRDQWQQITKAAGDIEQADKSKDHDKQTIATFVDRLQADLSATHDRLGKAIDEARNQPPAYAIVPYDGPNGTRRQPIYIECRSDAIVLQPEGIELTEHDFQGPKGPGNPLASTIRAARDYLAGGAAPVPGREPYPLLIVRSDGIEAFYMARSAMSSWASEFGYELIEADQKLAFQPPNPQLAQVEQAALADARSRYAWFATTDTAKEEEQPRARPVYRASRNGGGIVREGEASLADADGASTGGGSGSSGFGNSASRFGANGTGNGFSGSGAGNGNGPPGTGNAPPGIGGPGIGGGTGTNGSAMAGAPGNAAPYVPGNGYIGLPGSGAPSGSGYGPSGALGGLAGGTGTGTGYGPGNGLGSGVGNGPVGPVFVPGNGYNGLPGSGATNGSGNGTGYGTGGVPGGIPGAVAGTGTGGQGNGYLGLSGSGGPSGSGYGTGVAGVGSNGVAGGPAGYGTGNPGIGTSGIGTGTGSGFPAGSGGGNGATGYGNGVPTNGSPSGGSGVPGGNSLAGSYPSGAQNTGYGAVAGASGTNTSNGLSGSSGVPGGNSSAGQSGSAASGGAASGDPSSMPPPGSPTSSATLGQGGIAGAASGAPDGSGGDAGTPSPLSMLTPNINPQQQHTISDLYNTNATPYPLQSGPTEPHPGEYVPSQPAPSYSDKPKPPDDNAPKSHDSLAEKRGHNWSLPSNAKLSTPVSRTIHIECRGDSLTLKPDFGNPRPRVIPFGSRTADSVDKLVAAVWDYTKGWGIAGRQMYWRPRLELELGQSGEGRYAELQALLADSGLEIARKQPTTAPATQYR